VRRSAGGDWDGKRSILLLDSVMPASAVEPWVRSEIASIDPTVPVKMEPLDQTVSRLADRPRFETALLRFWRAQDAACDCGALWPDRVHDDSAEARDWRADGTGRDARKYSRPDYKRWTAHGRDWRGARVGSALAVSKMLKALLFEVSTYDPLTFIAVPLLLTLVTLVAILIPARAECAWIRQ